MTFDLMILTFYPEVELGRASGAAAPNVFSNVLKLLKDLN